uniref:Large ribosomal subunit protein mL42 n=1 Tax=Monodelphis domestica TaxID=13616 RepID=A0A5F8GCV3_MONDO
MALAAIVKFKWMYRSPLGCVCHKSTYSPLPDDYNCKVELALSSDGRSIMCYHPAVDIPYEHTKSICQLPESNNQLPERVIDTENLCHKITVTSEINTPSQLCFKLEFFLKQPLLIPKLIKQYLFSNIILTPPTSEPYLITLPFTNLCSGHITLQAVPRT